MGNATRGTAAVVVPAPVAPVQATRTSPVAGDFYADVAALRASWARDAAKIADGLIMVHDTCKETAQVSRSTYAAVSETRDTVVAMHDMVRHLGQGAHGIVLSDDALESIATRVAAKLSGQAAPASVRKEPVAEVAAFTQAVQALRKPAAPVAAPRVDAEPVADDPSERQDVAYMSRTTKHGVLRQPRCLRHQPATIMGYAANKTHWVCATCGNKAATISDTSVPVGAPSIQAPAPATEPVALDATSQIVAALRLAGLSDEQIAQAYAATKERGSHSPMDAMPVGQAGSQPSLRAQAKADAKSFRPARTANTLAGAIGGKSPWTDPAYKVLPDGSHTPTLCISCAKVACIRGFRCGPCKAAIKAAK